MDSPIFTERHMRMICVGTGAAGLCFAYKLQRSFANFSLAMYEKNDGVGGVWLENTYPGCAVDFPSHNYTYSFDSKFDWPRAYANGPEVLAYFSSFSHRHKLLQYCKFRSQVVGACWEAGKWQIRVRDLSNGREFDDSCDILINACGVLNAWKWPEISGLHEFEGKLLHSAKWDSDVNLTGKRVGLIGNGSSGQQILTAIHQRVSQLVTFFRQPNWVLGAFGEEPHEYTVAEIETFRNDPGLLLAKRKQFENVSNSYFSICDKNGQAQSQIRTFLSADMTKKLKDGSLLTKVIPNYGVGCRRPTTGIGYLESLSAPNVVVVHGSIQKITRGGVVDKDGKEHSLDVLICATGFDTSYIPRFPVVGFKGVNIQDAWTKGARAYMATAVDGCPNYFMFCGPNNPYGSGAYLRTVECQADYMLKFCDRWQTENILSFAPKSEAVDDFNEHCSNVLQKTVWSDDCNSWYKNPKDSSQILLWPGSGLHFLEAMSDIRSDDFDIVYRGNRFAWLGNGYSQTELDVAADKAFYMRNEDDSPLISRQNRRKTLTNKADGTNIAKPGLEAFGVES